MNGWHTGLYTIIQKIVKHYVDTEHQLRCEETKQSSQPVTDILNQIQGCIDNMKKFKASNVGDRWAQILGLEKGRSPISEVKTDSNAYSCLEELESKMIIDVEKLMISCATRNPT